MFTRSNGGRITYLCGLKIEGFQPQYIYLQNAIGKDGFQMALWWQPGDDTAGYQFEMKECLS